jgi:D-glycero-alpha-D-manno-heptose-7-phosphate kinase
VNIIEALSPCRVDLAGGTLDIWPLYLFHEQAVTVNIAIDRYTRATLRLREDRRIELASRDLGKQESFGSLDELAAAKSYKLPLAAWQLRFFRPDCGLDVETHSEAPAGAGISGSSSLMITLASALNQLTKRGYPLEKIREVAQNIEAQIIRVPTGCQDYYPPMYGGVNAIEMGPAGIRRVAIDVDPERIHERMVLAYTGEPRNSGINNWEVNKRHIDGDRKVHRNFEEIAAIANGVRAALARQDWPELARLIRAEWTHRKKNAPGITTGVIDHLVKVTAKAGAQAAKVCGAGGGGCVLFLVEEGAKDRVGEVIRRAGAEVLDVKVAPHGVKVKVRKAKAGK